MDFYKIMVSIIITSIVIVKTTDIEKRRNK